MWRNPMPMLRVAARGKIIGQQCAMRRSRNEGIQPARLANMHGSKRLEAGQIIGSRREHRHTEIMVQKDAVVVAMPDQAPGRGPVKASKAADINTFSHQRVPD